MAADFEGFFKSRSFQSNQAGEMAEWLKAHAWKACLLERVTWVRIPLSPPVFKSQPNMRVPRTGYYF